MDKSKSGVEFVFIQDRSLQLDVLSYIDRCQRSGHCALARANRANRIFCTDEKHIGTEDTVTVNSKYSGARFLERPLKIASNLQPALRRPQI